MSKKNSKSASKKNKLLWIDKYIKKEIKRQSKEQIKLYKKGLEKLA